MSNSKTQATTEQELYINFIRKTVLKSLNTDYNTLKSSKDEFIFIEALKIVTTTKKAVCIAFDLNLENMCRYKRKLENVNLLKQTKRKQYCRYTGHLAHYLTTNTKLINNR